MYNRFKQIIIAIVFACSLLLGTPHSTVQATSTEPDILEQLNAGSKAAGYGTNAIDPRIAVGNGIKLVLSLLGIIFVVLVFYAGFLIFSAAGDEENIAKAKKIISYAVIGLIIIISAYSITSFITSRIVAETIGY